MDKVKDDMDITKNYDNLGDHVNEIEINNRTVKEIYHAQYHMILFLNISKLMITYLDF